MSSLLRQDALPIQRKVRLGKAIDGSFAEAGSLRERSLKMLAHIVDPDLIRAIMLVGVLISTRRPGAGMLQARARQKTAVWRSVQRYLGLFGVVCAIVAVDGPVPYRRLSATPFISRR